MGIFGKSREERNRESAARSYAANAEVVKARARTRSLGQKDILRGYVQEYLSVHPCVDCGETDLRVLDFDHRDGVTKRQTISYMVKNAFSLESLQQEIAKCDVRCANCHRRRTSRQLSWWRG